MNPGKCSKKWCRTDHWQAPDHAAGWSSVTVQGNGAELIAVAGQAAGSTRCPRLLIGREDLDEVLVSLDVHVGDRLAQLLEVLGDATPDEIRALAAAVRSACDAVAP